MNISSTRAHPFIWLRSGMVGNIKSIGPISPGAASSNGLGRHVVANGRRPCEGARRCQAFSFFRTSVGDHSPVVATHRASCKRLGPCESALKRRAEDEISESGQKNNFPVSGRPR